MVTIARQSIYCLVILLMAVQPATFAFAMTDMDHGHALIEPVYSSSHDSQAKQPHGFAHHSDASGDVAHSDSIDNCCNSSACNFAYPAVDFLQATPLFPNLPVASIESAFSSADLALSIKPPMLDVL